MCIMPVLAKNIPWSDVSSVIWTILPFMPAPSKQCCAFKELNSHLRMVYDPVRAYWEQPPPWKIAVGLGVSVAVSSAFYQWWQQKYSGRRPITVTPAWEVASWLRSWNKEREAGPPVILNPVRYLSGYTTTLDSSCSDAAQRPATCSGVKASTSCWSHVPSPCNSSSTRLPDATE